MQIKQPVKISPIGYHEVEQILKRHYECEDPETWHLLVTTYRYCLFELILPPEPPFRQRYLAGGGRPYQGQWIWDAVFGTVLLAELAPDFDQVIREIFDNYWDAQKAWDINQPKEIDGCIPCAIWRESSGRKSAPFSQLPTIAWGLERVYRKNGDHQLVKAGLEPLERFHEWYWRERDVTGVGLAGIGSYTGSVQDARFETYDYDPCLDDLQLTPHPGRPLGGQNGDWYGTILHPSITALLILSEECLARLAEEHGQPEMAARRRKCAENGRQAMQRWMWDDAAGTYLALHRDTLEKIQIPTISSWIPLFAGIPNPEQAKRMAHVLSSPGWNTILPVPTVAHDDAKWDSPNPDGKYWGGMWRGDVWVATNYQIASGLSAYGYDSQAAHIVDRTIDNVLRYGINERYHCDTGEPLGVPNLTLSSPYIIMMVDGLSRIRKILKKQVHT